MASGQKVLGFDGKESRVVSRHDPSPERRVRRRSRTGGKGGRGEEGGEEGIERAN